MHRTTPIHAQNNMHRTTDLLDRLQEHLRQICRSVLLLYEELLPCTELGQDEVGRRQEAAELLHEALQLRQSQPVDADDRRVVVVAVEHATATSKFGTGEAKGTNRAN